MSTGTCSRIVITLMLPFLISVRLLSQSDETSNLRLMFYNVENFFDIRDDSLKEDNDFLPGGVLRWNYSRYIKKINSLYKTIVAAGGWEPPFIVGLCEVEKRSVLEELIYQTYLSRFNYDIVHEESPDPRGIDVCMIYRKDLVTILNKRYLIPADIKKEEFRSRSILYSEISIFNDTIHLFLNHWPSRRGGVLSGEPLRKSISLMLRSKVDSIFASTEGKAKIIIAGDFNCTPLDDEIMNLSGSIKANIPDQLKLYNMAEKSASGGEGSYRFNGSWEMLDQILLSESLINCKSGIYTDKGCFKVFKPDFLLKRDLKFPGYSPFSTYSGYRYQGGYSDHLPVILNLKIK